MQSKPQPRAMIEIIHPTNGKSTYQLGSQPLQIGRVRGDVLVEDAEVSSTHCQLLWLNDSFSVFDLNSSNGTFLNGKRIAKSRISDGDSIRIGRVEILFKVGDSQQSSTGVIPASTAAAIRSNAPSVLLKRFRVPTELTPHHDREVVKLLEHVHRSLFETTVLVLDVVYPDRSAEKLLFTERTCILGRVTAVGKFESDEEISRRHSSIQIESDGSVIVNDLGSTNGTFVNERRIKDSTFVTSGDVIRIGHTQMRASTRMSAGKGH